MDEDDLTLIEKLKVAQKNIVVEPDENQSKSAMQQYQEMGYTNVIADYNDGKIIENPTNERS